ncbi:U3 small nucleolar RNA-associated protein 14 A [Chamberlinius hualienensis]
MEDEDFVVSNQFGSDNESEDDDIRHEKLLAAVTEDGSKRQRKNERSEASGEVSEFNFGHRIEEDIDESDLIASFGQTVKLAKLRKKITSQKKKGQTLEIPLEKHVTLKLKRQAGYNKICEEVKKWDHIVKQNRSALQMQFPLQQTRLYDESIKQFVSNFEYKTPLERDIATLLQKNTSLPAKVMAEDESKNWTKLALADAKLLQQELKKIRARQTYQESRSRRLNKIKSKKYRQILKKERLKKEAAALEVLQKKDPKLFREKLEEVERLRALERSNLRHRNTGKWAKANLLKTKFKLDSGKAIQDQIELSRALTAKRNIPSESEDEAEVTPADTQQNSHVAIHNTDASNPWFSAAKSSQSKQSSETESTNVAEVKDYRKYWNEINENKSQKRKAESFKTKSQSQKQIVKSSNSKTQRKPSPRALPKPEELSVESSDDESLIDEGPERVTKLADIKDVAPIRNKVAEKSKGAKLSGNDKKEGEVDENTKEEYLDPNRFITVERKTLSMKTSGVTVDENALDDVMDDEQKTFVAEAFADDGLVEQFRAEKEAIVEAGKPKEVSLVLPGWGEWGGSGLKISDKKRQRFTIPPKEVKPRIDNKLGHVIINEEHEKSIQQHMPNRIPFPFRTEEEFRRSIANPIGQHWNTEMTYSRLIVPKVITKKGSIIKPINKNVLSSKNKKRIKPLQFATAQLRKTKLTLSKPPSF